jgi:hypothetical protein
MIKRVAGIWKWVDSFMTRAHRCDSLNLESPSALYQPDSTRILFRQQGFNSTLYSQLARCNSIQHFIKSEGFEPEIP